MMIVANLDAEWTQDGRTLPERVLRSISTLGTLLRVFAEEGDMLWTPRPVDRRTLREVRELPEVELVDGDAARPDRDLRLAWSTGSPCSQRGFALEIGRALGSAAPGACIVEDFHAFEAAAPEGPWVLKAVLSAAGRDRLRGTGPATDTEARAAVKTKQGARRRRW